MAIFGVAPLIWQPFCS